jgi:lipopolysaccharide biosynthesis glycosyltransferase
MLNDYVNINEIESKIPNGRKLGKNKDKQNEINIGIQLESNYVLRVMMTLSSIMDSQKPKTKLRFHLAVVLSFSAKDMLKIYSLRRKIREDVEFNFYNAKRVETELKNLNSKGPGAVAKLLLPQLLPDNIDRLIIFDTGDLLVLRDLSGMYNLDIKNYLLLGIPGKKVGDYALVSKKNYKVFINTGSMLVNVKKYKSEKIYEKCVRNKNTYKSGTGDQDLLNDISFGKVGYLPMKFGIRSPYFSDEDSDLPKSNNPFYYFIKYYKSFNPKLIPEEITKVIQLCNNPIVIHQFNGKWMYGKGLTVYRRIAQYYIKLAGIWDEMCIKLPGYCLK